ncbi:MAG: hypothetical protein ACKERG_04105 [Candidatus Hodgkinia cicadicola]
MPIGMRWRQTVGGAFNSWSCGRGEGWGGLGPRLLQISLMALLRCRWSYCVV